MFEQPPLETWLIIARDEDQKWVKLLIESLKDSVTTFNYFTKEPRVVLFRSESSWIETFKMEITNSVLAVICVISNPNDYKLIKHFLTV